MTPQIRYYSLYSSINYGYKTELGTQEIMLLGKISSTYLGFLQSCFHCHHLVYNQQSSSFFGLCAPETATVKKSPHPIVFWEMAYCKEPTFRTTGIRQDSRMPLVYLSQDQTQILQNFHSLSHT